jgi:ring-1,2-phenylacetyl-CoA epoxidase subunit PaaD
VVATTSPVDRIQDLLDNVMDPELSEISIRALGILRSVAVEDGIVVISITPTYSGCPAMGQIEDDIHSELKDLDVDYEVRTVLSPVWTTDWMTDEAAAALLRFGIAPPSPVGDKQVLQCPQCGAPQTEVLATFGSTACKALHRCLVCLEPFERFKAI